jgi:hypothetical protein
VEVESGVAELVVEAGVSEVELVVQAGVSEVELGVESGATGVTSVITSVATGVVTTEVTRVVCVTTKVTVVVWSDSSKDAASIDDGMAVSNGSGARFDEDIALLGGVQASHPADSCPSGGGGPEKQTWEAAEAASAIKERLINFILEEVRTKRND